MKMAGGLVVDTKDAPGGNSHLNMYAMNNGIPVLALPELATRYGELLSHAANEGGLYLDDRNGQFEMMTVACARERGLLKGQDEKSLLPGTNRNIRFLKPNGAFNGFEVFAQHEVFLSPSRPTRDIELYVPQEEVLGVGRKALSFADLSTLETFGRHLAGEKGLVLALMRAEPTLRAHIPDGAVVTTGRIKRLLEEAGLSDAWNKPWREDPLVGVVDDGNFTQSAFYTDAAYRHGVREQLQKETVKKLRKHLLTSSGEGLTAAGKKLYAELMEVPALAQSDNWIARSSYTGEDRPGKSGAGQYESFPHLKNEVSRIEGIIGVVESAWHTAPIENNVAEEIHLQHIMPSIVVQHCLSPKNSGVVISRNIETGGRGQVSYQLVKGFGGGVEGGKAEEGVVSSQGVSVTAHYPGETAGLVTPAEMESLRKLVLKVEAFFNEKVEPGKGHAVDMEVASVDGAWQIVQARVILLDK
jgi:hypothetical protein